ncbi:hypothetical protein ACJX0J_025702, partial [Zea mays]
LHIWCLQPGQAYYIFGFGNLINKKVINIFHVENTSKHEFHPKLYFNFIMDLKKTKQDFVGRYATLIIFSNGGQHIDRTLACLYLWDLISQPLLAEDFKDVAPRDLIRPPAAIAAACIEEGLK